MSRKKEEVCSYTKGGSKVGNSKTSFPYLSQSTWRINILVSRLSLKLTLQVDLNLKSFQHKKYQWCFLKSAKNASKPLTT